MSCLLSCEVIKCAQREDFLSPMIIIPKDICLLSCEVIKCAQREDSLLPMIIIPKDISCQLSCEVIKCAQREDSLSPKIIIPKDVSCLSSREVLLMFSSLHTRFFTSILNDMHKLMYLHVVYLKQSSTI